MGDSRPALPARSRLRDLRFSIEGWRGCLTGTTSKPRVERLWRRGARVRATRASGGGAFTPRCATPPTRSRTNKSASSRAGAEDDAVLTRTRGRPLSGFGFEHHLMTGSKTPKTAARAMIMSAAAQQPTACTAVPQERLRVRTQHQKFQEAASAPAAARMPAPWSARIHAWLSGVCNLR
jgi:hypothetical protein